MTIPLIVNMQPLRLDWTSPAMQDVFCALGQMLVDAGAGRSMTLGKDGAPLTWSRRMASGMVTFFYELAEIAGKDLPESRARRVDLLAIAVDRRKFG